MSQFGFSKASYDAMRGVHPDLCAVMGRALSMGVIDFSLSHGLRSQDEQDRFYRLGLSEVRFSKHQLQTDGWGHSIHAIPYPRILHGRSCWDDLPRFGVLAGVILTAASIEGVRVRWGGDWNGDGTTVDHKFVDAGHWELVT